MIKLLFITNQPDLARFVVGCGVDRIFVDLEVLGKKERQGHLDTVMSRHTMADVARVRAAIPDRELLVRLNPLHAGSATEVESAIRSGADLLMLPMCRQAGEVHTFCEFTRGRAGVIPLVETADAEANFAEICTVPGVTELFIGLNDLHLDHGLRFMFEPLANGSIDRMAALARAAGRPFGFGGIARMNEGLLPGKKILGEHLRLGSSAVILSRTFHRRSEGLDELQTGMDFAAEVSRLRAAETALARRSPAEIEANRQEAAACVEHIATLLAEKRKKNEAVH